MSKIVVVSDSHGRFDRLKEASSFINDADYYIHCGDSSAACLDELHPYASVKGNTDCLKDLENDRYLCVDGHRILITHGHNYSVGFNLYSLANKAKNEECDLVFYGHTHIFADMVVDGIRLINPGSLRDNRDGSAPCFALVEINGEQVDVKRVFLKGGEYVF